MSWDSLSPGMLLAVSLIKSFQKVRSPGIIVFGEWFNPPACLRGASSPQFQRTVEKLLVTSAFKNNRPLPKQCTKGIGLIIRR